MNLEKPKTQIEGTDLYDGMIFDIIEHDNNSEYLYRFDKFSLQKISERLQEYYDTMNDNDYTKGEELTSRLGTFINKYTFKALLDHVNFILTQLENNLDNIDTLMISAFDNHELLEFVESDKLIIFQNRMKAYHFIISGADEGLKDALFNRLGRDIHPDAVHDLILYIDAILESRSGNFKEE